MKTLIVGYGEVGSSLSTVLGCEYDCTVISIGMNDDERTEEFLRKKGTDIMHICFPCVDKIDFMIEVKVYQEKFKPKYTVVHSTVPVGVCAALGAIHSPIRGIHPNLVRGIKTFPKFLGGERASEVADYFRRAGLKVIVCDKSETTELGKLMDTEYYRACIEFTLKAKGLCDKFGLNFHEVYTLFNETYNKGYTELGHSEYVRPVLQPIMKEIGGHCVMPNKKLLEGE